MKSGKALVVLFVNTQKTVRNPMIDVFISFGQIKESLQCIFTVTLLLLSSAFLFYIAGFMTPNSKASENSDPCSSASVSRSSIASKEKFK